MSIAVSIVSTIIKSAVKSKVENELSNELYGISIDSISEKGINKINDFINKGKSKIDNILSEDKMKSMEISENNMAYVVDEIKELLSGIEITDEIFRQCKYDRFNLRDFLWNEYTENKTGYIEGESDIKKSLLSISEALIKLMRESEGFVKDISIQISNTVDDTKIEIQRISDYLEENFSKISTDNQRNYDILKKILEQNEENKKGSNITQEEKFQNNKKDKYLKIWNSRLFLHIDNDERPITLADAFIMADYDFRIQVGRIKFLDTDTIGDVINKFVKYDATSSMLITGAPGIGKTSITAWIANEYKDDEDVIILRFRDWDSEELDRGLLKAVCETLKCENKELENKVLILDGFDEIKSMDNRDSLLNIFFNDILDFDNLKMIITSRPNYIDSHGFRNFFELLPFGIDKISQFYEIIKGVKLEKHKIDRSNLNVIGIPVILYMAIMSDIDLTQKATKPELYSRIFAEEGGIFDKFCYEGIGYDKGNHILRNRENVKMYLNFLGEVAFKMFEKNDLILNKGEYEIPELCFQGSSIQIMDFPIKYIFDNTKSTVEFIHNSIYEYFVSEYIYIMINFAIDKDMSKENFAGILGEILKENIISYEILEFLKFKIRYSSLNMQFDLLREIFQMMLQDGMTYHLNNNHKKIIDCEMRIFKNMLDIIHLWINDYLKFDDSIIDYIKYNYKFHLNLINIFLRGKSLQRINLTKVILKGADLSRADLRNANLEGVDLREAILKGADLSEANMKGANLSEADLRGAILIGTNLNRSNMKRTDLRNANMMGSNLKRVDLRKANMRGADLRGAGLENVDLREADITEMILDETGVKVLKNGYNLELVKVLFTPTQEVLTYKKYCKKNEINL